MNKELQQLMDDLYQATERKNDLLCIGIQQSIRNKRPAEEVIRELQRSIGANSKTAVKSIGEQLVERVKDFDLTQL